ncbi:MAG: carotenoid 1,2-hydratase [Leptothrix sp. (in: Bacteria)]|nr:carotenoid 1,2-hydratase [Leptothrix sp. (in: b-proteobacteria)]
MAAASGPNHTPPGDTISADRMLAFPQDHGAHLAARTEWWYATGWLGSEAAPTHGFQITFFRSRTGLAEGNPSRFAARQLLFAHAAVTALALSDAARPHGHDQRIVRWNGREPAAGGHAAVGSGAVQLGGWSLHDNGDAWRARADGPALALDLRLARSQPLLRQGRAGFSRKGPEAGQASHYYSEVQLAASGRLALEGREAQGQGRAWLDHEWSDQILAADAVGWDWMGINLFDGSALTAFVLRRADGSALWAGGSFRAAGAAPRSFAPDELRLIAGRRWRSPATGASYPVAWQLVSPAGRHSLRALADAQELDSRASTGTVYWEGLSELLDGQGRRVGLGYLEMTGYAGALKL